jgi:hypothetical protein
MSALGDIMAGLRTVVELAGKVEGLSGDVERLESEVRQIDRRLVRVETIIEMTRSDGAVLRLAKPGNDDPR